MGVSGRASAGGAALLAKGAFPAECGLKGKQLPHSKQMNKPRQLPRLIHLVSPSDISPEGFDAPPELAGGVHPW